ncbi:purine-cytosine permease family protein [Halovivax cerinus]|uniref:Purine-cytosine permease family protein n=1 Tax=Halovivax cerinus TaxID=1487865 RepID=A0ABD5NQL9_9EURY|nr:cytosine permease [Halovivax cerinus]
MSDGGTKHGGEAALEQDGDVLEVREDYPTEPVPEEERRHWFATLTVWAGWTISITAFLVGGLVGGGLPVQEAVPAIFVGNIVLAVVGALIGYIGMKTGLSTYMLAQLVFGKYGSIAVSIVIGIFAMGFVGVFAGATGNFITGQFSMIPVWLGAGVFVVGVVGTALYGFLGLEYLSRVAVPGLWILALLSLFMVHGEIDGGLGAVGGLEPANSQTFAFGVTMAISVWITGASITADIGRYAKNKWHVLLGAFGGWILGATLLESVSAVAALGVGEGDLVQVMIDLGLFWPALFIFLAAMWTTADNNLYSFSLALTSLTDVLGRRDFFSKEVWVVIGGVLVWIGAVAGLYSQFQSFLTTVAIAAPPMAGILIARFYLLGYVKKSADEIYADIKRGEKAISVGAVVAWIAASLFAYFVQWGSPAVNSLVLSMVLYTGLFLVLPEEYR